MISALEIRLSRVERSRLDPAGLNDLPFGKYFTDHMLEVDYSGGQWGPVEIKPFQPLLIEPSNAGIHYGQSIFEGIKAYRDRSGNAFIFRPHDNFIRFNRSAERMQMPAVPEEIFMEGMRRLVDVDRDWIPPAEHNSLYIRPFMFATDSLLRVHASDNYKFMIILSPCGPYYPAPMRIWVEETYVRAVRGGIGQAKAAGNYAASLMAATLAKEKGYDQVLWTDATEHRYVQEIGTMNVIFIIGNRAITPDLESGTILAGVTRDTAITLLREQGLDVEERPLSIDEVIAAHHAGTLREVFGTGTAATVSYIKELRYRDFSIQMDPSGFTVASGLKNKLTAIREGREADVHGWLYRV